MKFTIAITLLAALCLPTVAQAQVPVGPTNPAEDCHGECDDHFNYQSVPYCQKVSRGFRSYLACIWFEMGARDSCHSHCDDTVGPFGRFAFAADEAETEIFASEEAEMFASQLSCELDVG